jgi:RNA polymerase sigma-70 factor (ECF subfamily)
VLNEAGDRSLRGTGNEEEIIHRAARGDGTACETLVRQNFGWIFSLCCRWARSKTHAEDLAQEVFIRVFQNLHSYRGERGGFRTWLRRIARNLLIDSYRGNRLEQQHTVSCDGTDDRVTNLIESVPSREFNPEDNLEKRERKAALRRALRLLGPGLRKAVILRDVQGLTYEEIGNRLNMPVGTAKSKVSRGRLRLARLLRQRWVMQAGIVPCTSALR